ncbi:MAG: hypothetical protein AABY95_10640 [Pseudomonadota bacterium]
MTRSIAGLVVMTLLLAACASEREVMVRVPVSRLELPEPAPRKFGAGPAFGGEARARLTPDQTTTVPDPDAPELSGEFTQIARFDFQMQPTLGFALKGYQDGLAQAQIKWIALGPGTERKPLSLALTAAYGFARGNVEFAGFNDSARTEFDQSVMDLALIFGFKLDPQWMLYGGPYYVRSDYDGSHSAQRGGDPDVNFKFEGDIQLTGVNLGVAWSYADWGRLLAEYSLARVEAGRRNDRLGQAAISAEFFFGRRADPVMAEAPNPPVEVVPVQH